MEIERALQQLELLQKKLYAYHCADSSLYLDAVTTAPSDTSEGRGVAMSILAGESQKLMTSPETKALLDELSARAGELDLVHRREVEELRRSCEQLTRIPADEYMAYKELCNRADDVWHKAKAQDDFALFCPVLQELVDYNRRFAGYYDASKAPYDALLNEYERGGRCWTASLRRCGRGWCRSSVKSAKSRRSTTASCIRSTRQHSRRPSPTI